MSHKGSILCLPDAIVAWEPVVVADLTAANFRDVFAAKADIDFVLLGTGDSHVLAPAAVREAFRMAGLPLDVMATGPAARTYNILLAEGRRVVAALLQAC